MSTLENFISQDRSEQNKGFIIWSDYWWINENQRDSLWSSKMLWPKYCKTLISNHHEMQCCRTIRNNKLHIRWMQKTRFKIQVFLNIILHDDCFYWKSCFLNDRSFWLTQQNWDLKFFRNSVIWPKSQREGLGISNKWQKAFI